MADNRRVIKVHADASGAREATPLSLESLEQRGRQIVERARKQAQKIVADALTEARTEGERIRAEARETGYREGFEKGSSEGTDQGRAQALQEAAAELEQMQRSVQEMTTLVVEQHQDVIRQARRDLLSLAVAVARRLVKAEVRRDSIDAARRNLEAALELASLKSKVWIHVNPSDAEGLKRHLGSVAGLFDHQGDVELLADKSIAPGGAVVRTEAGEVDARLGEQMDKLERELLHPTGKRDELSETTETELELPAPAEVVEPDEVIEPDEPELPGQPLDEAEIVDVEVSPTDEPTTEEPDDRE